MTPAAFVKKYESLKAKKDKIQIQIEHLISECENICPHPKEYHWSYSKDHDNGYGRWWKTYHTQCKLCTKEIYKTY